MFRTQAKKSERFQKRRIERWWFEEKEKMEKSLKINSHLRVSNAGEEIWAISRKLEDRKKGWWFEKKEKIEKSLEINSHLCVSNGCRRILKRFQERRIEREDDSSKRKRKLRNLPILICIYVSNAGEEIWTISKKEDRKMMVRRENGEINSHLRVSNGVISRKKGRKRGW